MGTKRDPVNPFPQQGAWRGYFHGHYILEDLYEDIADRWTRTLTVAIDIIMTLTLSLKFPTLTLT